MISPGGQRRAVVDRHDADAVDLRRLFRVQRVRRLDRLADHDRLEAVDLASALPATTGPSPARAA